MLCSKVVTFSHWAAANVKQRAHVERVTRCFRNCYVVNFFQYKTIVSSFGRPCLTVLCHIL